MTEYDKIWIQRKPGSIYLCIGFDNGDNNIKVEIPKFMQDDIIKEFCKDDYMTDIKFFIKKIILRLPMNSEKQFLKNILAIVKKQTMAGVNVYGMP
jgi:hypothetical protein